MFLVLLRVNVEDKDPFHHYHDAMIEKYYLKILAMITIIQRLLITRIRIGLRI